MPPKIRKRPASFDDDSLHRQLVQCGTKTGLTQAISALSTAGWLKQEVLVRNTHAFTRKLTRAHRVHCDAVTPYGTVVQKMPLPLPGLPIWEYCHPLAFIHYMSTISVAFASTMDTTITAASGTPLRIILYIDEICPGNPLRPDKGRTLQAIYWAILEWPQWLLSRTAAWPCFGTLRTSHAEKLDGFVAELMRRILCVFFPSDDRLPSFAKGVAIVRPDKARTIFSAVFAGFLADEKALNQISGSKGASGQMVRRV